MNWASVVTALHPLGDHKHARLLGVSLGSWGISPGLHPSGLSTRTPSQAHSIPNRGPVPSLSPGPRQLLSPWFPPQQVPLTLPRCSGAQPGVTPRPFFSQMPGSSANPAGSEFQKDAKSRPFSPTSSGFCTELWPLNLTAPSCSPRSHQGTPQPLLLGTPGVKATSSSLRARRCRSWPGFPLLEAVPARGHRAHSPRRACTPAVPTTPTATSPETHHLQTSFFLPSSLELALPDLEKK